MLDLINRGYQIGGGMLSPDGKLFYLNIPKNASTFLSSVLHQNNWYYGNLSTFTGNKIICVLRDPINRWLSGMSTYSALYLLGANYGSDMFIENYNELTERIIFDNIVFDDHTTPQIDFVNLVPKNKEIIYFSADNNLLLDNLSKYLGTTLDYNLSITNENASENNYDTRQIRKFLVSRLTENLTNKLKIQFKQDYQLLDYVTR
jgi:hypothetical protein